MGQIAVLSFRTDFCGDLRKEARVVAEEVEAVAVGHRPTRQWFQRIGMHHHSERAVYFADSAGGRLVGVVGGTIAPAQVEVETLRVLADRLGYDLVKR